MNDFNYVPIRTSDNTEEEKITCPKCQHEFIPESAITWQQAVAAFLVVTIGIILLILFIGFCVSNQNLSSYLSSTVGDFFVRLFK